MKLETISRKAAVMLTMLAMAAAQNMTAGVPPVQFNAGEILVMQNGTDSLNREISGQTTASKKTAIKAGVMDVAFATIVSWQDKYNNFLKNVSGYTAAAKAGTTIYAQGVEILRNMYELQKAINKNPEGIAAVVPMTNLYIEIASDFVKTYNQMTKTISAGGGEHMINTAKRTEMMWQLADNLDRLNKKIRKLTFMVSFYRFSDVWYQLSSKWVKYDKKKISTKAIEDWKRSIEVATALGN